MVEFLFNKVAALETCNFIKKTLQHRCFPVYIAKFLRTPFFTEHLWWLFLHCAGYCFVQSWPKQTKTKLCKLFSFKIIAARSRSILHKIFSCAVLSQMYLENIEYTIFLCNVSSQLGRHKLSVYFAKKSCLLNMGQHCTGKFFAQCWST